MPELTEADFAWWDALGGDLSGIIKNNLDPALVEKVAAWARMNLDGIASVKNDVLRVTTIAQEAKALLEAGDSAGALTKLGEL